MTAFLGRSGADAISAAINHICIVDRKYHAKMLAAIELTRLATLITDVEAANAVTLLNGLSQFCLTFTAVANNSGFPIP